MPLNLAIMKSPYNWATVLLMLAIGSVAYQALYNRFFSADNS